MELFLRIDINIIAAVLLLSIVLIARKSLDLRDKLNITFINTALIIITELIFETLTCIVNTRPERWLIPVSVSLHLCLFIVSPVLTYFWCTFVHSWLGRELSPKKKFMLRIPVAINCLIVLLSPFFGFVFSISEDNVYQRGSLFLLASTLTYAYLVYSLILIFLHKKHVLKQDFLPLFAFGILPIIGGLMQSFFYGVLLMWSSCAFSFIIVYSYLQQRMVHLDSLTGVWTRNSFENYLKSRAKQRIDGKLGIIFLDIDGLKRINDDFGHLEGDFAIRTAIDLIRNVVRKTDIIARFGGDEFVVIMDCECPLILAKTIERIRESFEQFNSTFRKKYKLECSIGADIMSSEYNSIDEFMNHVDNLMYRNKNSKKTDLPI